MSRIQSSRASRVAFCPVLADMVKIDVAHGRCGKSVGLGGMSSINNIATLRRLHLDLKAKRTLEVGFAVGGSALVFTQTHRDLGSLPSRQHVAIDPYQKGDWMDECGLVAVEKAGLDGYLDFKDEMSCYGLPELAKRGQQFDIVYIDGSHLFEDVFVDFYYAMRILSDDGVMIFDDCTHPDVRKVLRFISANFAKSFPEFDLTPYRDDWLRYRIAHSLGRTQMRAFRRHGDPIREWNSVFRNF